jgi:hypothetical protein
MQYMNEDNVISASAFAKAAKGNVKVKLEFVNGMAVSAKIL